MDTATMQLPVADFTAVSRAAITQATLADAYKVDALHDSPALVLNRVEFVAGCSVSAYQQWTATHREEGFDHFSHAINTMHDRVQFRHYVSPSVDRVLTCCVFSQRAETAPNQPLHATAVDCAADWAVSLLIFARDKMCMTAEIKLDYVGAVTADRLLVTRAHIVKVEGRKTFIAFEGVSLRPYQVHFTGSAIMIEVPASAVRKLSTSPGQMVHGIGAIENEQEAADPDARVQLSPVADFAAPETAADIALFTSVMAPQPLRPRAFEFSGELRSMELRQMPRAGPLGSEPALRSVCYFSPRSVGPGSVFGGCVIAACREALDRALDETGAAMRVKEITVSFMRPIPLRTVARCMVRREASGELVVELLDGGGGKPLARAMAVAARSFQLAADALPAAGPASAVAARL